MKIEFDSYTTKARLLPVLFLVLPIGVAVSAWSQQALSGWSVVAGLATSLGLTAMLSQVGRDAGRAQEPRLFEKWGGAPTTRMFRHRDGTIDRFTKARYHAKLAKLLKLPLPDAATEERDSAAADDLYKSCVKFLLQHTRDHKKFGLIFAENINYGYRRNVWAMRPAGIVIAAAAVAVCAARIAVDGTAALPPSSITIAATVLNAVLLAWWLVRIREPWVRTAAEAFALRLLEASEALDTPKSDIGFQH